MASLLAALAATDARGACTNTAPASGETVTCTFDTDPVTGGAIDLHTPIIAPNSTGVTVNIDDDVERNVPDEFDDVADSDGTLSAINPPVIDLGHGATIVVTSANVSVDVGAYEGQIQQALADAGIDLDQDIDDPRAQRDLLRQVLDIIEGILPADAEPAIRLGGPDDGTGIRVLTEYVTVKKAQIADQAMSAITDFGTGGALDDTPTADRLDDNGQSSTGNLVRLDKASSVNSLGTGILGLAGSSSRIEINDGTVSTVTGAGNPGVALEGGGALEVVLGQGDIITVGDGAAGIDGGDQDSALGVRLVGGTFVSTVNGIQRTVFQEPAIVTSFDASPAIDLAPLNSVALIEIRGDRTVAGPSLITAGNDSPVIRQSAMENSTTVIDIANAIAVGPDEDDFYGNGLHSFGNGSPIIGITPGAAGNNSVSISLIGSDATTEGWRSGVIDVDAGSDSDSVAYIVNSNLTARRAGSTVVEMSSQHDSSLTLVAGGTNVTASGGGSAGIVLHGAEDRSSLAAFLRDVTIRTAGDDAPGFLAETGARGGSATTVAIDASTITTIGDRSAGYVFGPATEGSSADMQLSGLTVRTEGKAAFGISAMFDPTDAVSAGNASIADTHVTTTGAYSDALHIGATALDGSVASADVAGSLATSGKGAVGVRARIGATGNSSAVMDLANLSATTSGNFADGVVLESGVGAQDDPTGNAQGNLGAFTSTTSGAGSNALHVEENVVLLTGDADFTDSGRAQYRIDSLDGLSATGVAARAIQNDGTIDGGATGLTFSDGVIGSIANAGAILTTGPTAVTYGSTNDIFELRPGGTVTGLVDADGGTDTFILGGVGTDAFDRNLIGTQYLGFERFEKEDTSVWMLNNPNNLIWTVRGGELVLGDDTVPFRGTPFVVAEGTEVLGTGTDRQVARTLGTLTVAEGVTVATDGPATAAVIMATRNRGVTGTGGIGNAGVVNVAGMITTSGAGAAGVSGNPVAPANAIVNGLGVGSIVTSGAGSGGIAMPFRQSSLTAELSDDFTITTTGADAAGIRGGDGDSVTIVSLSDRASITTGGAGSAGVDGGTADNSLFALNLTVGLGGGTRIATTGAVAPAIRFNGPGNSTGLVYIDAASAIGSEPAVRTTGVASSIVEMHAGAMSNFSASSGDALLQTEGNGSHGFDLSAGNDSSVSASLRSGAMTTAGEGASVASVAVGDYSLLGARFSGLLSSTGDRSPTVTMAAGSSSGLIFFSDANHTTTGDDSPGVVIAGSAGGTTLADISGVIDTSGARSHGFWLDRTGSLTMDGAITVSGADASGAYGRLGNGSSLDISVAAGADIAATGTGESYGIHLASTGGTATAMIDIAEGARVFSQSDAAIGEGNAGGGGGSIDTTLTVAGRVERPDRADIAIDLSTGNDTIIVLPTADIIGGVDMGAGTDTVAFDGTAGTTGRVALLADSVAFAVGVERIEKRGEGTWVFEGDAVPASFQFAPGFVLNGTAVVNASVPSLDLTNRAAGRVEGTGTVRNFVNQGQFAPAGAGVIGTFNVAGDLTLEEDGTLEVDITADGKSDRVIVDGAGLIGGRLDVNGIAYPDGYPDSQTYTIVTAEGGISGSFASVSDNLPDVDAEALYNANDVQLTYTRQSDDLSQKQNGLAAVFGAGHASLGFAEALAGHASLTNGSFGPAGGVFGADAAPLAFAEESAPGPAARAIYGAPLAGTGATPIPSMGRQAPGSEGYGIWVSAFGDWQDIDGSQAGYGYQSHSGGVLGGVEYRTTNEVYSAVLGIAAGYSRTDVDVDNGGADIDSGHVGLYGALDRGAFALNGAIAYSFADYDLSRSIALIGGGSVAADGSADGDAVSGFVKASYDVAPALGGVGYRLAPAARLRGFHASRGSYTESGSGILNLAVDRDSANALYGGIGIEAETSFTLGTAVLTPQLSLFYEHDFAGATQTSSAAIAAASATYLTDVSAGAQDRFAVGAGLGVAFSDAVTGHIRYDGAFGEDTTSQRAAVGLTFRF